MIVYDCEQNSPEWEALRVGIPTASLFDKIITPGGTVSTQREAYANRIIGEQMAGHAIEEFKGNGWTDRGHECEQGAVDNFCFTYGVEARKVGLITNDDGTAGCSLDRFVGENWALEVKSPSLHKHVSYMEKGAQLLVKDHWVQLHGQLLLADKIEKLFVISHFEDPSMVFDDVVTEFVPDPMYMIRLQTELNKFTDLLNHKRKIHESKGRSFCDTREAYRLSRIMSAG